MSRNVLVVTIWEDSAIGILRVKARDAAKHPQCTKQPSTTNDYLTPNFNYAEVEKPCSSKRGMHNKWLCCGGIYAKIYVSTRYQSKYVCMGGRGHWGKLHGK